MKIKELYSGFIFSLCSIYDKREAENITDWVFESTAGLTRMARLTRKDEAASPEIILKLNNQLEQLLDHKPVQYVLGQVFFYKMSLAVNEHVLIPRPETEELAHWVISHLQENKLENSKILDLGTGSGCIAIALKKYLPLAKVTATDISKDALFLASQNAITQNTKMDFLQFDFLDEQAWKRLGNFDIIVSNPPYIPFDQKEELAKNVTSFEPHIALFVPDNDPFIFYKKIASFASTHLNKTGNIFLEVHESYAKDVASLFATGEFSEVIIKKDLYGNDRMVCASNKK